MILNLILIAVLGFIFEQFLPWWSVAIAAFTICAWRVKSVKEGGLTGLSGVGILWLLVSLIIHFQSGGILTRRIATLFNVHWSFAVIMITVLIAAIVGGLAGISGFYFRRAVFKKKLATDTS